MYQLDYPWLLALLPLPLAAWWLLPPFRQATSALRIPFFNEVLKAAGLEARDGAEIASASRIGRAVDSVCWALLVLALCRPQYVEPPLVKVEPERDLLLAIDLSQSMDTADFLDPAGARKSRVEAVRAVVADFVGRRPGDRIGVIAFGDAPYPLAPFTLDHATVQAILAGVLPGIAGPRTALGDAIGLAIKMFSSSSAPDKVLIVLTDGNDTASKMQPAEAAGIAKENGIIVHTVGIGDPQAAGEDKLDQDVLQKIASATGGRYFFGQDQSELAAIYRVLDQITPANQQTLSWRPKIELFHYPLGLAVVVLALYHLAAWAAAALGRRATVPAR